MAMLSNPNLQAQGINMLDNPAAIQQFIPTSAYDLDKAGKYPSKG
jgi:hypothetical protein